MKTLFVNNMENKSNGTLVDQEFVLDKCINPYDATKTELPLLTHSSALCKLKASIAEENKMGILSIDIDEGNFTNIEDLHAYCLEVGLSNFVIYTTASHNPSIGKYKFRAVIWLDDYISCEQFTLTQLALCELFGSDKVMSRIQQILYLPSHTPDYQYIDALSQVKFNIESSEVLKDKIIEVNDKRKAEEALKEAEQTRLILEREQKRANIVEYDTQLVSVFDLVKEQFRMEELLAQYGFKKKGSRYLHPNSSSGLAGVLVLEGMYYSHHSLDTDPLADGHAHSCFDLIMEFEHGGSKENAIESLSNELMIGTLTLKQHNEQIKTVNYDNEIQKNKDELRENLRSIRRSQLDKLEQAAIDKQMFGEDDAPVDVEAWTVGTEEYDARIAAASPPDVKIAQSNVEAIKTLNKDSITLDVDSDEIINFDVRNGLMPTKEFDFDLTRPGGLVEKIISDICVKMHRSDHALAIGPALYIAMRAGLPTIENSRFNESYDMQKYGVGLKGFKIYLNVLMVGLSASGKDKPQELLESTLRYLGEETYGRIASDKDLINNVINSYGSCCSVIDEAGSLFSNMANSKNDYMRSLSGQMMQFATAKHKNFDGLIKRAGAAEFIIERNKLVRSLDQIDEENEDKKAAIEAKIKLEIKQADWKIKACQDGVEMPQFSILATSTPTDMTGVVNMDSLNTGQLSRYLLFCGKTEVEPLKQRIEGIDYGNLEEKTRHELSWIKNNAHLAGDYHLQKAAENTCNYIEKWFESRRNHGDYAVMYRRGFELVMRVVSMLSVKDRVVTKEQLEWSFCLVRSNIESFIMTCSAESKEESPTAKMAMHILNTVKSADKKGAYKSQLRGNMASRDKWKIHIVFFDTAIEHLVKAGFVRDEGSKIFFTGKNSID